MSSLFNLVKQSNSQTVAVHPSVAQDQGEAKKLEGFDFLRAVFSVVIVALKSEFLVPIKIVFSSTVAYFLAAEVGYLAVPVFLQISLFLLFLKGGNKGLKYFFQKRLPRLLSLYFFWVGLKVLFDLVRGDFKLESIISSPRALIEFIVSGGNSPFFFFFSLILLSTLASLWLIFTKRLKETSKILAVNYLLLFVSCLFVFSLSQAEAVYAAIWGQPVPGFITSISNLIAWDYNPLSFLPYLFTAAIVAQEASEKKLESWSRPLRLRSCGLLFLAILFSIWEWYLFQERLHYSRLSLVFSSWLLLYWGILTPRKAPAAVAFLSTCSLGIYGFHVFFTQHFDTIWSSQLQSIFKPVPLTWALVTLLLPLLGSIGLTLVFRRVKFLKNFV